MKVPDWKLLSICVFFFVLAYERIFIKTHSIESRLLQDPENTLFTGVSVFFRPGKFTGWNNEGVNGSHPWSSVQRMRYKHGNHVVVAKLQQDKLSICMTTGTRKNSAGFGHTDINRKERKKKRQ